MTFQGVIVMRSKWGNKQCPLCMEGILHAGSRKQTLEYRGRHDEHSITGAFCDHCHEGFPNYNAAEEVS
jgi:YgiT-type zinc finger domain-containing protein